MKNSDDIKACVKFTPYEYTRIYHSRLQHKLITKESDELDAICLLYMRLRSWGNKNSPAKYYRTRDSDCK